MTARPPSLVAERAVRYLREAGEPVTSVRLAREILALRVGDEHHARRVLDAAFGGDPRLAYGDGAWRRTAPTGPGDAQRLPPEPDIAFVVVEGTRVAPRAPLRLTAVTAARRRGETILAACGGDLAAYAPAHELKAEIRALLDGAHVAVHAPPGGLAALEAWLEEPIEDPLPVALLGRRRLGLPAAHGVPELAARLGLAVRVDDDPARRIELLPLCFDALGRPGETWKSLMASCRRSGPALPWERYAFTRDDLHALPAVPGTYRFHDLDGRLLYVGKSGNLRRRLCSWFQEGIERSPRERAIVDAVHRYEIAPSGSELEALLREAAQIRRDRPERNVQRRVHGKGSRARRLTSILILEPAEPPLVLRAWLIKDGRLIESIPLGPRGGGLKRVARVLDRAFFDPRPGPTTGPSKAVDVEIVARWLSEHRDRAVAFDPTHLRTVGEVVDRLKWFLDRGSLVEGGGTPILPRG